MIQQVGNSVRYPGGKNAPSTWQWILNLLPTHSVYVEPFVGSGAVLRRKAPALRSIVLDKDETATNYHRGLAMPGVEVLDGCGIEFTEQAALTVTDDWCFYFDPPYELGTRVKQQIYKHELSRKDHVRLLGAIRQLDCPVIISGYKCDIYQSCLAGWYREERWVTTRGTKRLESIWCNFHPRRQVPHDTRWPGPNYRERERIMRKAARWKRMYLECPSYERRALLGELMRVEQQQLQEHTPPTPVAAAAANATPDVSS